MKSIHKHIAEYIFDTTVRLQDRSFVLFSFLVLCWIIGYRYPELVTEYTRGQNYFDTLAGLFIVGGFVYVIIMFCINLFRMEEKDRNRHLLFEQTAAALANAIDAKDKIRGVSGMGQLERGQQGRV